MTSHIECILLIALSSLVQAAFVLPIRYFRGWRWEQMWVAQAIACGFWALLWACMLPRETWRLAAALPLSHWILCYALGVLWGVGGVAYGLTSPAICFCRRNHLRLDWNRRYRHCPPRASRRRPDGAPLSPAALSVGYLPGSFGWSLLGLLWPGVQRARGCLDFVDNSRCISHLRAVGGGTAPIHRLRQFCRPVRAHLRQPYREPWPVCAPRRLTEPVSVPGHGHLRNLWVITLRLGHQRPGSSPI